MKEMVKGTVDKSNVAKNTEEYCYSWDGEMYYGKFASEEEAVEAAKVDRSDAMSVYVGTCTEPAIRWNSNEEKIIESIYEQLIDDVGEAADNFEVSREAELDLAAMIDATVGEWIKKNAIKPNCYKVLDGHLVSLKGAIE